jgi:hypothetical protein
MAVSLSSTSTMPSPPIAPPRSSSLSPGTSGGQTGSTSGRSRSSRRGTQGHREVRFGNYILGQTLGEGEFGKVKLGWRRPEPGQTAGDGVQVTTLPPWIEAGSDALAFNLFSCADCVRLLSNSFEKRVWIQRVG